MYNLLQNKGIPFLSTWDSLNILNKLLEFSNSFKYSVYAGRLLKRGAKDGCEVFKVGRTKQWAFADCLRVPKADPETIGLAIFILRQVATRD